MLSFFLRLPDRWPHALLGIVVLGWTGLALISAPLFDLTYHTNGLGPVVLGAYVLAFMLGSWFVQAAGQGRGRIITRPPMDYTPLFVVVCAVAILGVGLRLFDHVILRGSEIAIGEIARRKIDISATADQSSLGLIAAPLVAFCYLPTLIVMLTGRRLPGAARLLAYGLTVFPALEALVFQGGSSGFAYAIIMLLCINSLRNRSDTAPTTALPAKRSRRKPSLAQTLALIAVLAIILMIAASLYLARITEMTGWSVSQYMVFLSTSSQNILIPSPLLLQLVDIPVIGSLFMGIYWFCLYVTSGVHNFIYVVEVPAVMHTAGGTQGQVFVRAFDILTGNMTRPPIVDANPLAGFYQTMFGDVYLDFGIIGGIIQSLLMGLVSGLVHRARLHGRLAGQILDPVLKTFVMMGVFVSSLSAFGLFILIAALCVLVMGAFLPHPIVTPGKRPVQRPEPDAFRTPAGQ